MSSCFSSNLLNADEGRNLAVLAMIPALVQ